MTVTDNGYNPLRWNCKTQGCFNVKCRPKIEVFFDCFPGRINFGDVDAQVEINGIALQLEWKSEKQIKMGQKIAFERLTKGKRLTVLCLEGNAETMKINHYLLFYDGKMGEWKPCDLNKSKNVIKLWVSFAKEFGAKLNPGERSKGEKSAKVK